jgi:hypothetical protein
LAITRTYELPDRRDTRSYSRVEDNSEAVCVGDRIQRMSRFVLVFFRHSQDLRVGALPPTNWRNAAARLPLAGEMLAKVPLAVLFFGIQDWMVESMQQNIPLQFT